MPWPNDVTNFSVIDSYFLIQVPVHDTKIPYRPATLFPHELHNISLKQYEGVESVDGIPDIVLCEGCWLRGTGRDIHHEKHTDAQIIII